MSIDPRITIAALVTLLLQAAGAFLWAGQASARLEGVERRLAATPPVIERLARLEEQVAEARRSLARIEDRLEPRR